MSSHLAGSLSGREVCDSIFRSLELIFPDVQRKESSDACAFKLSKSNSFAYVYHVKTRSAVKVFFRGDDDTLSRITSLDLHYERRKKIEPGWPTEFPLFVSIKDPTHAKPFAEVLRSESVPLAAPKRARKAASRREVEIRTKADDHDFGIPEEVNSEQLWEGAIQEILVNRFERDTRARELCLEHHGKSCVVCDFDFGLIYGPPLVGFIHVHHKTPLASIGESYVVNPIDDLCPVCPNCHAAMHRRIPPFTVEEVQGMMEAVASREPCPPPSRKD